MTEFYQLPLNFRNPTNHWPHCSLPLPSSQAPTVCPLPRTSHALRCGISGIVHSILKLNFSCMPCLLGYLVQSRKGRSSMVKSTPRNSNPRMPAQNWHSLHTSQHSSGLGFSTCGKLHISWNSLTPSKQDYVPEHSLKYLLREIISSCGKRKEGIQRPLIFHKNK